VLYQQRRRPHVSVESRNLGGQVPRRRHRPSPALANAFAATAATAATAVSNCRQGIQRAARLRHRRSAEHGLGSSRRRRQRHVESRLCHTCTLRVRSAQLNPPWVVDGTLSKKWLAIDAAQISLLGFPPVL